MGMVQETHKFRNLSRLVRNCGKNYLYFTLLLEEKRVLWILKTSDTSII